MQENIARMAFFDGQTDEILAAIDSIGTGQSCCWRKTSFHFFLQVFRHAPGILLYYLLIEGLQDLGPVGFVGFLVGLYLVCGQQAVVDFVDVV